MGKDFIPLKINGLNIEKAYKKLFSGCYEITEASDLKLFNRIAQLSEIEDIQIGSCGTKESIIILKDGRSQTINKTIKL